MVGKLLIRGLLVGLVAGLIAFGFARVYGEPSVDSAIAFEEQMASAEPVDPNAVEEAPLVTREVQSSIGLLTGIVVLGVGLGGVFSIVFSLAAGRVGKLGLQQTSMLVAVIGFMTVSFVPWLKYPASPPASTLDDTIQFRTAVYFLMLAVSIAATAGAWLLRQQLLARRGAWNASMIAAAGYVVVLFVFFTIMPTINETPAGFPATVMWDFRLASIGIQAVLWAAMGVLFGPVVERTMNIGVGSAGRNSALAH
jgi:hypothetical protein